ncbi:MAG: glycosyltransferase family 2 protein [Polyangiaceae bacterium]|nr:glycosyltransferase family 2 protein [Polyangiaceae bacterium]
MLAGKRIAVVVPAKNEALFIAETLSTLPAFVDDVVVIDDGSSDRTAEIARQARPEALVVTLPRSGGVGAAIALGYQLSFERGADVAAVMAGDGQMDPRDLEGVVAPACRGAADYVKGERLSNPNVRRIMPSARRRAGRVLGMLTRIATGIPRITDSQCGYTAIERRGFDAIDFGALWRGYGYPNDLLSLAAEAGLRTVEVPVRPVYRGEASGIRPWHVLVILGLLARAGARRFGRNARRTQRSLHDAPARPTANETRPLRRPLHARASLDSTP